MSNAEMLDTCIRFIMENHNLVTDEHLEMLEKLWNYKYGLAAAAAAAEAAADAAVARQQATEKPLPPSPPPEPECQNCRPPDTSLMCWCDGSMCHMCYRVADAEVLAEAQQQTPQQAQQQQEQAAKYQCIPQIFPVQELTEQPDTDGEDEAATASPEPKKPKNPIYTNRTWPSPIAKVFVQKIRGTPWPGLDTWPSNFKKVWHSSGNTELRLTHDNCMRYLAHRMGLTPGKLLEKTPREVHARLIGEYHGVPGYYTKRSPYYY
jgi:hypothetical protein